MRRSRKQTMHNLKTVRLSHVSPVQQNPNSRQILVFISAILIIIAAAIGLYLAWSNLITPGAVEII